MAVAEDNGSGDRVMSRISFSRMYRGERIRRYLAAELPGHAAHYLDAAFSGEDATASRRLVCASPNEFRGLVVAAMYGLGLRPEAYRGALHDAWLHDHAQVIEAADHFRRLEAMFRWAAFPLPDDLPETVTVYRGTSGVPMRQAGRGFSWTLDRDAAEWFAMRFADINGRPLVLRRDVPREHIMCVTNERAEAEAVIFRRGPCIVEGTVADWTAGQSRYEQRKSLVVST